MTIAAVAAVLVAGGASAAVPVVPAAASGGITADPGAPGGIRLLPASAPARPPDTAQRRWLASGEVPGVTAAQRAMAARALLDLALLTRPDGAVAAAWHGAWKYSWPRDSSWAAAALAAAGHGELALRILRFLARVQPPSGIWAARYQLSGSPVRDGRPAELDSDGWFPWAVWVWYASQRESPHRDLAARELAARELAALWPAISRAAGRAARLGRRGLPPVSLDYWEHRTSSQTLGIAAPLRAGLRAAADLASALGHTGAARYWRAAAGRLSRAITVRFGRSGYQRTPASSSGADAAVTFLGPPFSAPVPAAAQAVAAAARVLILPNGGVAPGRAWAGVAGEAWTPETGFFALYDAASGDRAGAAHWLGWLAAHRTRCGSLPEQVNADGQPASVAPLAWTDAIVLLALTAEQRPLPMP